MGVQVVKFPNGDIHLGAEVDGVFVSFGSHSAVRVAQLVERGHNLKERAENGDELARDQIGTPLGDSGAGGKSVSKWTVSELDEYAQTNHVEGYPVDGNRAEKAAAVKAYVDERDEG